MELPPVSQAGERGTSPLQPPWKQRPGEMRPQPLEPQLGLCPDSADLMPQSPGHEGGTAASQGSANEGPGLPASDLWSCPDGSFVKKIITRGRGLDKPKLGSRCRVLASGFPSGSGPPEGWTELTIGVGAWREETWGELVEKCLESMCQGEQVELQLPGHCGPPVGLTLASFTAGRDSWELAASEKEAWAREERDRGTQLFRAGNPQGAARCYGRALRLLLTLPPPGPPERTVLHANLAACQLLLGQPQLAVQSCDRVLEREPGHVKALYRRGVAQAALGNLDKAAADLKKVLSMDPKNRAAQEALERVVRLEKKQEAGLAQGLRKMFG
ncbi:FK506-binding protein-like [Ochotona curzoniae]|uniref:FK506-binding protein-like n=1 Tax=Ochotona curzoniae TaxID=130825 RepID=UPI001B34C91E|nr:FK506-binding protein-like [Ochotona curzoniae]